MGILLSQWENHIISILVLSAVILPISLSYIITFKTLKVVNFANSEVFMLSGVISAVILRNETGNFIEIIIKYLILTGFVGGITSYLIDQVGYKKIRKRNAPKINTLISAVAISLLIKEIVRVKSNSDSVKFNPYIDDKTLILINNQPLRLAQILTVLITIITTLTIFLIIKKTSFGLKIRTISSSPREAKNLKINIERNVALSFFIAGSLSGITALNYLNIYQSARFDMGFQIGLMGFASAIAGGIDNIGKSILGTLFIASITIFFGLILGSQWRDISVFITLILFLIFRPSGFGGKDE